MTEPCSMAGEFSEIRDELSELRVTIGAPPNRATGALGSGLCQQVALLVERSEDERRRRDSDAAKPAARLRTLQTVATTLAVIVGGGALAGAIARLLWLVLPRIVGG